MENEVQIFLVKTNFNFLMNTMIDYHIIDNVVFQNTSYSNSLGKPRTQQKNIIIIIEKPLQPNDPINSLVSPSS